MFVFLHLTCFAMHYFISLAKQIKVAGESELFWQGDMVLAARVLGYMRGCLVHCVGHRSHQPGMTTN